MRWRNHARWQRPVGEILMGILACRKAENTPLKGEENRADADFLNDLLLHNNKKIPAFQHTEHLFSCQVLDRE